MTLRARHIFAVLAALTVFSAAASAQFREEAFTQSYVDPNDTTARDSTDKMFSLKEYFGGLAHKREARIGVVFAGSTVFVGGSQIYNRDYWKLPVIYGGIGTGVGLGIHYNHQYKATGEDRYKTASVCSFAGAALFYWGSLLDGAARYDKGRKPNPGRSTIYSILLPGLGQAYNGEYWKIPIYWGTLVGAGHYLMLNNTNYRRYKRIHNEATNPEIPYEGSISGETALYYRNVFRRYRDYSIVALAGFYLLQVIDANVFAYMQDFDMGDDISMSVGPSLITTDSYAMGSPQTPAMGLSIGLKF